MHHRFIITFIIVLAALLRVTGLSSHMPALYGDEISIGYNAYSILRTGHDEFGKFFPIQFESWGDQKNPVYIYITSLFQIVFGLTEWSVRLPSALSGVAAVYLTYLFTSLLFQVTQKSSSKHSEYSALVASLLLACSPWHIHISRGGYEANLALTLGLLGSYYLVKHIQSPTSKHAFISLLSYALAMYTYYTTKMFIPMLLLTIFIWGYFAFTRSQSTQYIQNGLKYFAIFAIACIPIVILAIFDQGQARFQTINIFANPTIENRVVSARNTFAGDSLAVKLLENRFTYYVRDFLEYYFDNFSGQFLFVSGDSSLRYAIRDHGMMYLVEAPFLILGFLLLFKHNKKVWILITIWLLLAPLPTALVGRAYGLRSIAILPIPLIYTAYGLVSVISYLKKRNFQLFATATIAGIYIFALSNWLARYTLEYPIYGRYWYDSMQKEMIEYAKAQEEKYDNIVLTRYYGKTEMYYAFYDKIDPLAYQQNSVKQVTFADSSMVQFGKYYFGDIQSNGKSFNELNIPPRTLVIASPKFAFGQETINAQDDKRVLFKVVKY